jgi:hypothetical protein
VNFNYNPERPLSAQRLENLRVGGRETAHPTASEVVTLRGRPYAPYWPAMNLDNDYLIDWQAQKSTFYSGIPTLWAQDAMCQESMGAQVDRSREHLCSADVGVIRTRRRILQAMREYTQTQEAPPYLYDAAAHRRRSVGIMLSQDAQWVEATQPFVLAEGQYGYEVA